VLGRGEYRGEDLRDAPFSMHVRPPAGQQIVAQISGVRHVRRDEQGGSRGLHERGLACGVPEVGPGR
jgi:hypothetical protein